MKAKHLSLLVALALAGVATSCQPNGNPASISGTIEVDEVHIAPRTGGRVVRLLAQEGDALTSGQTVAELAAPELRAQRERQAAQLAELEAGPRPEEIAAGKAEWEAQTAQLDLARLEARRADELFAQKAISSTEHDRAQSAVQTLERSVAAAKARYDLLLAGTRPERLAAARAELAQTDALLAELTVTAPTNCVLETLGVKVGDVLPPNREVATLLLTDHLWVRVFVPEPWLGRIKLGESATVRVDAFPGRDFHGTVEQIARAAEFTPRNVQTTEERVKQVFGVKVRLDNANGDLRAGMAADVTFENRR
ncbi:MAG TPA: efflux RND transporter periplasmic adaptor subunit [Verrucomicrobiae bacterium]|nr:efflux RND transporter periplasmic adaptor subunit [Verrucomicrobiae bacterium]